MLKPPGQDTARCPISHINADVVRDCGKRVEKRLSVDQVLALYIDVSDGVQPAVGTGEQHPSDLLDVENALKVRDDRDILRRQSAGPFPGAPGVRLRRAIFREIRSIAV